MSDLDPDFIPATTKSTEIDPDFVPQTRVSKPDLQPAVDYLKTNIDAATPETKPGEPKKELTWQEKIEAGWQHSSGGLYNRGKLPEIELNENPGVMDKVLYGIGSLAGDAPAMLIGGAGATAMGVPGGPLVGGFAFPAMLRKHLMDKYSKGEVTEFSDYFYRTTGMLWEGTKGAITGRLTGLAGPALAPGVQALSPLAQKTVMTAGELATMTTVGSALELQVPSWSDFVSTGIILGGAKGIGSLVTPKVQHTYAETGIKPIEMVKNAEMDPTIKQDLLSINRPYPKTYFDLAGKENFSAVTKPAAKGLMEEASPNPIRAKIKDYPVETSNVLSEVTDLRSHYQNIFDRYYPVADIMKQMGKDPNALPAHENAYKAFRNSSGWAGKFIHSLKHGTFDFETLKITGKGLDAITDPVTKNPVQARSFDDFLVSKKVIEKEAQGIPTGFDLEAAKKIVSEGEGSFGKAAKEVTEWKNSSLDYREKAGLISPEENKLIKSKNLDHVTFDRIFPEDEGLFGRPKSSGRPKKMTGSDKDIRPPLEASVRDVEAAYRAADINHAKKLLVELDPDGVFLEEVKVPKQKIKITEEELAKHNVEGTYELEVFRSRRDRPLAKDEMDVFIDGKRKIYRMKDEGLRQALESLDPRNAVMHNLVYKGFRALAQGLRLGVTTTQNFMLRNFTKDQQTRMMNTTGLSNPVKVIGETLDAIGEITGNKEAYQAWLRSGGANSEIFGIPTEIERIRNLYKLDKETGLFKSHFNVLRTPIDKLIWANGIAEMSTRLGDFKSRTKGIYEGPQMKEAGFQGREATVDFDKSGSWIRRYGPMDAFLSPTLAGMDRTIRQFKNDPAATVQKGFIYLTLPTIAAFMYNRDKPQTRDASKHNEIYTLLGFNNWVPVKPEDVPYYPKEYIRKNEKGQYERNDGWLGKIPKPELYGFIFQTLVERVLDRYVNDNPDAFKNLDESINRAVIPNFMLTGLAPFLEQQNNRSQFMGTPVVPESKQRLAAEEQFMPYTSETAKQLSKIIPDLRFGGATSIKSPLVIDNFINGLFSSVGQFAVSLSDQMLKKSGVVPSYKHVEKGWDESPFTQAFLTRFPTNSSIQVRNFYDSFTEVEQKRGSVKALRKEQALLAAKVPYLKTPEELNQHAKYAADVDKRIQDLDPKGDLETKYKAMSKVKKNITDLNQMSQSIRSNPSMSPEEKRQLIERNIYANIRMSKRGLEYSRGNWEGEE